MTDSSSWIDRAKRLLKYRREAAEFLERVSGQIPVSPSHAASVSLLWAEADELDAMVCGLLNEMNAGLMAGRAEAGHDAGRHPRRHRWRHVRVLLDPGLERRPRRLGKAVDGPQVLHIRATGTLSSVRGGTQSPLPHHRRRFQARAGSSLRCRGQHRRLAAGSHSSYPNLPVGDHPDSYVRGWVLTTA